MSSLKLVLELGLQFVPGVGKALSAGLDAALIATEMVKHVDEALLTFYIKEWKRYTTAGTYNNHLFRYLNRHWVKREMD